MLNSYFLQKKSLSLSNPDGIHYLENSASARINVGKEGYFNNETILAQFKRLFILLLSKKAFDSQVVGIVVNNAQTHAAKEYNINDSGKDIGTQCSVDFIHYLNDDGILMSISCKVGTKECRKT